MPKPRLKLGEVAQPLRAALTGAATSPGIFDVMEVLGREETLGAPRRSGAERACTASVAICVCGVRSQRLRRTNAATQGGA